MPKLMRSIETGVEFDYCQDKIDTYPNLFEAVPEVAAVKKAPVRRRRKKAVVEVEQTDELDNK